MAVQVSDILKYWIDKVQKRTAVFQEVQGEMLEAINVCFTQYNQRMTELERKTQDLEKLVEEERSKRKTAEEELEKLKPKKKD